MSSMGVAKPVEIPPLERQVLTIPAAGNVSPWRHWPLGLLLIGLLAASFGPAVRKHTNNGEDFELYSRGVFLLWMWGICVHGIWDARRKFRSLVNLTARSELMMTAEAKKVGEYSGTTQTWFLGILFLTVLLIEFSEIVSLFSTRAYPPTLFIPLVVAPMVWLFTMPWQRGRLEVRSMGLVWHQLKTTEFIPWCAVREWGFRGDPRESVLTIQVVKKKGEMEEEKIGLMYLNEGERERVRELMEEYCGEGVLSGKARA